MFDKEKTLSLIFRYTKPSAVIFYNLYWECLVRSNYMFSFYSFCFYYSIIFIKLLSLLPVAMLQWNVYAFKKICIKLKQMNFCCIPIAESSFVIFIFSFIILIWSCGPFFEYMLYKIALGYSKCFKVYYYARMGVLICSKVKSTGNLS